MDKTRKKQALEILDYWKIIEFLSQTDIPEENPDNKKTIAKIKKGEKVKENKIEIFTNLAAPTFLVDEIIEKDALDYAAFPTVGGEIAFCIGRTERNSVVSYLEKFMVNTEDSPEIAYPKKSAIAWFSFRTDKDGLYLEESFQLSPILWAISEWEKCLADKTHNFSLDTAGYDEIVAKIEESLSEKNVDAFLPDLYEEIYSEYVKALFPETKADSIGFFAYNRYVSEEKRDEDEDPADYADLGKSFFLNDIILLSELIESGQFGDKSDYEKEVISYILAGYEKIKGMGSMARTIISPDEPAESMRKFFSEKLNVSKAPLGKWPAKFMPALMQQVAVNIAIDHDNPTPVFSVNGPPGTGKTTLLKEIIASNIVDRAKLLADNGKDPDTLFEKHSFTQGSLEAYGHAYFQYAPNYYSIKNDAINDYGMLVASCNNAAVENITIDLPKGKDILESLEASESDGDSVKRGLDEVRDLFDLDKSEDIEDIKQYGKIRQEKDIFFTRYANKLLDSKTCWGLVSAPFGKRSNIIKYCNAVLKPFVEEYKSNDTRNLHKQRFAEQREIFLKQYGVVRKLQEELKQLCAMGENIPEQLSSLSDAELSGRLSELEQQKQSLNAQLKSAQTEIMQLEESRPKGLFAKLANTSTRDSLIAEHRKKAEEIKSRLGNIEIAIKIVQNVVHSRAFLQQYTDGDKKMSPIDAAFMENYTSAIEKLATKAQVTNPWFTAQYNREREKLFLYACRLHKEFVTSSKCMRHNIINLLIAWNMFDECGERMGAADRNAAMPCLLQSIFLMTPVISTTFASAQAFLSDIGKSGVLGTLIVDESGQAQPQMAVGAMFRCHKSIIVGDPKQIEPVVTAETDMIKQLMTSEILAGYKDKKISVQGFADYLNPYGTFLGEDEEKEWVGCPLVVHRRCIDPMYTISNRLSYDGTMKQQTGAPKASREATFILEKSCWIDVTGSENPGMKDHFVKAQGEVVLKLLEEKFKKDSGDIPKLFIITPFTSVKRGMIDMVKKSALFKKEPRVKGWLEKNNVGTVHTFQGQGTDEVIFLLGCDKTSVSAANWVNKNIVNVAATRAKFRFYIIGDKNVWGCKPVKVARELTGEMMTAAELDKILSVTVEEGIADEGKNAGLEASACPETTGTTSSTLQSANAATPPITQQKNYAAASSTIQQKSDTAASSATQQKNDTTTSSTTQPQSRMATSPNTNMGAGKSTSKTNNTAAKQIICSKCGKPMIERKGKFGKFMGCTGFPDCRNTEKIV